MAAQKQSARQFRIDQQTQLNEAIDILVTRLQQCKHHQKELTLLDSVSLGLYEEVDKLAKKAAAEEVTELALGQINGLINDTKKLLDSDQYIQKLNVFIAAGDNPQHRDAVLVLRQIRQGLERFKNQLISLINLLNQRLKDAQGILVAIELLLGNDDAKEQNLKDHGAKISSEWFSAGYNPHFNFTRLDRTNIKEYFAEANLS